MSFEIGDLVEDFIVPYWDRAAESIIPGEFAIIIEKIYGHPADGQAYIVFTQQSHVRFMVYGKEMKKVKYV